MSREVDAFLSAWSRLDAYDQVWVLTLSGLLLWWLVEWLVNPSTSDSGRRSSRRVSGEQSVELDEETLRYLERGNTVRLSRWNGYDLVLAGQKEDPSAQVITISSPDEDGEDVEADEVADD